MVSLWQCCLPPPSWLRRQALRKSGTLVHQASPPATTLSLDLYAALRAKPGNCFFSPYSIATALAMTCEGARGQTAAQMRQLLHLPAGAGAGAEFAELSKNLAAAGKQGRYQLNVANSLWVNQGLPLVPEIRTSLWEQYGAALTPLDFAGDPESARKTINAWVGKKTQEKIKDLLKSGMLDSRTRLVLVNAIYFKGNWAEQFKKENTREGAFTVCAKEHPATVSVPLMNRTGRYSYGANETAQVLELPYVGGDLSMVVLLPAVPPGAAPEALAGAFGAFEPKLTPENLAAWLGQLRPQEVRVTLPRFKASGEYELSKPLAGLGMTDAFAMDKADFSGMVSGSAGQLCLSAVAHKAFVDVNEEGTEAAAATGAVMVARAVPRVAEFRADRSFVFLIRDIKSGAILFLGRLLNPKEE